MESNKYSHDRLAFMLNKSEILGNYNDSYEDHVYRNDYSTPFEKAASNQFALAS